MTGATQPALTVKLVSKAAGGAALGGTWRLLRAGGRACGAAKACGGAGGRTPHTSDEAPGSSCFGVWLIHDLDEARKQLAATASLTTGAAAAAATRTALAANASSASSVTEGGGCHLTVAGI